MGLCVNNHESLVVWPFGKFHALLDSSLIAFSEGFGFEAVASLAAGLERFIEWYIRVIAGKHGAAAAQFDQFWNTVSKQSERQLGAFYTLQMLERAQVERIPDEQTAFRNKVLHNGYFPRADETREYGRFVFGYVCRLRTEAYDGAAASAADELDRPLINLTDDAVLLKLDLPASAMEGVTFDSALKIAEQLAKRLRGRRHSLGADWPDWLM